MPVNDFAYWLGKFILEVRKRDGHEYPPKSLYALVCCFKRHFEYMIGIYRDMRMCAIKSMAALFTAMDRKGYQKLISGHIVDVLKMPQTVLAQLRQGGWTVSLTGRAFPSVAVDESHETSINKDCKRYVTHPSAESMIVRQCSYQFVQKQWEHLRTKFLQNHLREKKRYPNNFLR